MDANAGFGSIGGARPRLPWRPKSEYDRNTLHNGSNGRHALLHWIFLITLAAIVTMGWALLDASNKAHESSARVVHTHEVLTTISEIHEQLSRGESALRGYVLSGNASFLIEREIALTALTGAVHMLRMRLADNPEQQPRADLLRDLVDERSTVMSRTLRLYESGGADAAAATLPRAQHLMARIDSLIREMESVELARLDARRQQEAVRHDRTLWLLIAATVLALLIVVPSYVMFMMQIKARAHVKRRLFEMADAIPGVVYRYRSRAGGVSHYEFLSAGVEGLFGVEREAALRDASIIAATIVEEDKHALALAIAYAAENLIPLQHEFRVRPAAGGEKWVRSSAAPEKQADDSIVWNGHWADITMQKQLANALHEAKEAADTANRAKSTFLAVMSHEIRTPLNGVLGMLELLSLTKLDPDQRSTLTVVRESGKSLQRIIDEVLDFSKIEAGKLEIAPEPACIREVVESVRNIYAGNASSKGLLLTASVDPEISRALSVDPLRLRQILNNLVSNAIKFTFDGGIEIDAELLERNGDTEVVRFTVADHGIGMSPEVQARLFQPFVQGAAGTTRTYGGTGLGLTICRRLAGMMGGTIEVESELGQGTTMVLTLPLQIADADSLAEPDTAPVPALVAPARSAPSIEQAEREGTLVLVVDDHPVNRMLLSRQVMTLGYAVECASNGIEALQKWISGRFGAVITDCNMPEMDGYQLARRIRELELARGAEGLPIIACTANALRGEAEECLAAGMNDYLAKPVPLAELQKKLTQWLPLPQAPTPERETPRKSPAVDTSVFNASAIAALTGGDDADNREVFMEFQRATEADAAMLEQAFAQNDVAQVMHISHRMKGASRMVGLMALATACECVEKAARAHDAAALEPAMERLERELERAGEFINQEAA